LPSGENISLVAPRQSTDFSTRSEPSSTASNPIWAVLSWRLTWTASHFPSGDQSSGQMLMMSWLLNARRGCTVPALLASMIRISVCRPVTQPYAS
jgi:hypothetical protein